VFDVSLACIAETSNSYSKNRLQQAVVVSDAVFSLQHCD